MTESLKKNIDRLGLLANLLDGMGNIMANMGKGEKDSNQTDFFRRFTADSLGLITEFAETLNYEELGHLMQILIKLTGHTTNLSKFMELTPEEKIIVGEDLKNLSKEMFKLIEQLKRRSSPK